VDKGFGSLVPMVGPEPGRGYGMSPDIDISLQLPIDPSDSKGLAILNKPTLMRIAQILYQ
jgi:hypothetical protein